jgi:hypothetical protein
MKKIRKNPLLNANADNFYIAFIWIKKGYQKPSPDGGFNTDRAIALYGYCPVGPAWQ